MLRIQVLLLGEFFNLNRKVLESWDSKLFRIVGDIQQRDLNENPDLDDWEYSDNLLGSLIQQTEDCDFTLVITNVGLEKNYFARRISKRVVVCTLYEIKDYLIAAHLPLENIILRHLYAYSMLFRRLRGRLPVGDEETDLTHVETKKCLFDFNADKSEVVYSCDRPILCHRCEQNLRNSGLTVEDVNRLRKEISGIKKRFYFRVADFVKEHPILSILISSVVALIINVIGSVIANSLTIAPHK